MDCGNLSDDWSFVHKGPWSRVFTSGLLRGCTQSRRRSGRWGSGCNRDKWNVFLLVLVNVVRPVGRRGVHKIIVQEIQVVVARSCDRIQHLPAVDIVHVVGRLHVDANIDWRLRHIFSFVIEMRLRSLESCLLDKVFCRHFCGSLCRYHFSSRLFLLLGLLAGGFGVALNDCTLKPIQSLLV